MGGGRDCCCTTPTSTRPLVQHRHPHHRAAERGTYHHPLPPRATVAMEVEVGVESVTYQPRRHPRGTDISHRQLLPPGIATCHPLETDIFHRQLQRLVTATFHQTNDTIKVPRRAIDILRLRVLETATCHQPHPPVTATSHHRPPLLETGTCRPLPARGTFLHPLQLRESGTFHPQHQRQVRDTFHRLLQPLQVDLAILTCVVIWATTITIGSHILPIIRTILTILLITSTTHITITSIITRELCRLLLTIALSITIPTHPTTWYLHQTEDTSDVVHRQVTTALHLSRRTSCLQPEAQAAVRRLEALLVCVQGTVQPIALPRAPARLAEDQPVL